MWLKEIEMGMKQTLYSNLSRSLKDFAIFSACGKLKDWITKWPGQITVLVMHIMHNNNMEKFFDQRMEQDEKEFTLQTMLDQVNDHLNQASELI